MSLRGSSVQYGSCPLQWKVFHMDILRWPQVTRVFQMVEDKSVTPFLPQHMLDTFLCGSSEQVCSAAEADGKPPPSWVGENWA